VSGRFRAASGWFRMASGRLRTAFSRTHYGGYTKSRPHDRNNNNAQTIGRHCVRSTAVGCVRPHSPPRPQKSNLVRYSVSVFQMPRCRYRYSVFFHVCIISSPCLAYAHGVSPKCRTSAICTLLYNVHCNVAEIMHERESKEPISKV